MKTTPTSGIEIWRTLFATDRHERSELRSLARVIDDTPGVGNADGKISVAEVDSFAAGSHEPAAKLERLKHHVRLDIVVAEAFEGVLSAPVVRLGDALGAVVVGARDGLGRLING